MSFFFLNIRKVIFEQESSDDKKKRKMLHKIIKLIVNNRIYNEEIWGLGFKALSSSLNPKYKVSYKGDNN